jgi:hypothetical protein
VFYIRHKVQKAMLSRSELPQDSSMPALSDHFRLLEGHDVGTEIIRHTKINKVLKGMLKLNKSLGMTSSASALAVRSC